MGDLIPGQWIGTWNITLLVGKEPELIRRLNSTSQRCLGFPPVDEQHPFEMTVLKRTDMHTCQSDTPNKSGYMYVFLPNNNSYIVISVNKLPGRTFHTPTHIHPPWPGYSTALSNFHTRQQPLSQQPTNCNGTCTLTYRRMCACTHTHGQGSHWE